MLVEPGVEIRAAHTQFAIGELDADRPLAALPPEVEGRAGDVQFVAHLVDSELRRGFGMGFNSDMQSSIFNNPEDNL